ARGGDVRGGWCDGCRPDREVAGSDEHAQQAEERRPRGGAGTAPAHGRGTHGAPRYTGSAMSLHVPAPKAERNGRRSPLPPVAAPFASSRALDAAEKRIEKELRERYPNADLTGVAEAYRFARAAHGPQ